MEYPPGVILTNGTLLLGLRPTDGPAGDRFDENRVGLDHLSFNVASRADLEAAARRLDEAGVPHSDIYELVPFGIALLPFRDPDGIQLELTAPL
jgi:catechol 2,3-dioxygenase-like lactoylglutathione lyase family enzyme